MPEYFFSSFIIGVIALLHIYILILEMFLWDKPSGLKAFGHSLEKASHSKVLAANQGLYNGFLAAGLCWGLLSGAQSFDIKVFFLSCVLTAGLYGGITAKRKILYIQALPASIGLLLLFLQL